MPTPSVVNQPFIPLSIGQWLDPGGAVHAGRRVRGEAGQGRPLGGAACSESVTFSTISRGGRASVSVGRASAFGAFGSLRREDTALWVPTLL